MYIDCLYECTVHSQWQHGTSILSWWPSVPNKLWGRTDTSWWNCCLQDRRSWDSNSTSCSENSWKVSKEKLFLVLLFHVNTLLIINRIWLMQCATDDGWYHNLYHVIFNSKFPLFFSIGRNVVQLTVSVLQHLLLLQLNHYTSDIQSWGFGSRDPWPVICGIKAALVATHVTANWLASGHSYQTCYSHQVEISKSMCETK